MNKGVYSRKPPFINFRDRGRYVKYLVASWIKVTASFFKIIRVYARIFENFWFMWFDLNLIKISKILINYSFQSLFIDTAALKLNRNKFSLDKYLITSEV